MAQFKDVTPPARRPNHHHFRRQTECPRPAHHPLHRRRRHRAGHLARQRRASSTPPSKRPTAGRRKIAWMEVYAGEKSFKKFNNWLPDDTVEAFQTFPGRHQRPADHARRRRHSLAQRRPAADARSLRLPSPGAIFHRRSLARQTPGKSGHGDLPRKHRGHLRRHRIRRRHARERRRSSTSSPRISPRNSRRSASAPKKPRPSG